MSLKKGREKVIQSLLRQQNMQLEHIARDHVDAKNSLEEAKQAYLEMQNKVGEIESGIRESAKEGAAISVDMMQWQRLHLDKQRNLLTDKKTEKDQAHDVCDKKHKELIGQKQIIETFERLAEKYKIYRQKNELKKVSQELDALSALKSIQKR